MFPFIHLSYFVLLCDETYVQLKVEKIKSSTSTMTYMTCNTTNMWLLFRGRNYLDFSVFFKKGGLFFLLEENELFCFCHDSSGFEEFNRNGIILWYCCLVWTCSQSNRPDRLLNLADEILRARKTQLRGIYRMRVLWKAKAVLCCPDQSCTKSLNSYRDFATNTLGLQVTFVLVAALTASSSLLNFHLHMNMYLHVILPQLSFRIESLLIFT